MLWGFLGLLIVLALLVTGIVWLVRSMASERRPHSRPPSDVAANREILDARYARGEISRDEYRQARQDLGDPLE